MVNYLMTLGWAPKGDEIQPWAGMQDDFRLEDVNHSPAFFDVKKLSAFNGEYIRRMTPEQFLDACRPWLLAADAPFSADRFDESVFLALAPVIQPRCATLADAPGVIDFVFLPDPVFDDEAWAKAIAAPGAVEVLRGTIARWVALPGWSADPLKTAFDDVAAANDLKPGKAQAPVRIAVTGRTSGPPLYEPIEILGRDETLRRLRAAEARLG
jgi:glutamyl-tRNA synthetase